MSDGITFRSSVNGFNRNEVIKYIESLLKEKEELSFEIKTLEAQKKAAESELAKALENLEQEKQKCIRCDVAQKAEAKLGAAMLDAKRFSETLVRDAEARTSEVFADASEKPVLRFCPQAGYPKCSRRFSTDARVKCRLYLKP